MQLEHIEDRFQLDTSATVLLGEPGSGKSALLSKIASGLLDIGATVFAIKADYLSTDVRTETDLQRVLNFSALPSDLILRLAALQPVYVFIDQLDALANQLDLRSERLNVLLNLVRRIGRVPNVHVLLSARNFEFNHDVRLQAIEAEAVTLALPPWHEVNERLAEVGINPDTWPEKARDVVRIPQALKTFIALVSAGRAEPFSTYQAMLEQLWQDRIASADDSESLIALSSEIAGQMAEGEALWLAVARFDDRLISLKRLEALGFIVRSENNLSISFSHQTVFDYILARTFVRSAGLLSTYVLERQDSLFIRAKIWSALNYLREAEVNSYEREFLEIWRTRDLRRHLRLLLIEFLGQVGEPRDVEMRCMAEALNSPELHMLGLKAVGSSPGWFSHFASGAISDAMSGSDAEVTHASRILALNWRTDSDRVIRLIKDHWLPYPERDSYAWMTLHDCPIWTSDVEEVAVTTLQRTPISIWQVEHTAMTIGAEQQDVALRLIRAKLDFLLAEARNKPAPPMFPENGDDKEQTTWWIRHDPKKPLESLLDAMEWNGLPVLAEASPTEFLQYLWDWYVEVFSDILSCRDDNSLEHIYPGQYILGFEFTNSEARSSSHEKPVMIAIQIAVEELAEKASEDFSKWARENSHLEILAVQQLIAHGYKVAADHLASEALTWLLLDQRRFQLGTVYGHRSTTIDLVRALVPNWSKDEIGHFETTVNSYRPHVPDYLVDPRRRKVFYALIRATKKDLLQAIGLERLAPESRKLVVIEQRALGDSFDRSIGIGEGGVIGSPMDAVAMAKAKDRDILKIFREIPDNTNWDHPVHWMRGGNIQLSRAFAEFSRTDPERAICLMDQFEPRQQERAAGYALDAMADDAKNDMLIIDSLLDLHSRGFRTWEFKNSTSRAIEKIASRNTAINEEVIEILVEWLNSIPVVAEQTENETVEDESDSKDEDFEGGSILWSSGGIAVLPSGNFNILSALASILLKRNESGRDRFLAILEHHLSRESDPNVWQALLNRLANAGGSTPHVVSTFLRKLFDHHPGILATPEAVYFLAYAQRWDNGFVFDLISDWRNSDRVFMQRAYGELVGLIATVTPLDHWKRALEQITTTGTEDAKIGLAYAAVNFWPDETRRKLASEILVALLNGPVNKGLVAAVVDVFRVTDELVPDEPTFELLRALACSNADLSTAPATFVVDRLQALLPYEAELVATIAEKLVAAWSGELVDITGIATAAPQLTDLALTLHRLGGRSRQAGVNLFEMMIEIDAYGVRETLAEIDGRFGSNQVAARRRLARRRRTRSSRR